MRTTILRGCRACCIKQLDYPGWRGLKRRIPVNRQASELKQGIQPSPPAVRQPVDTSQEKRIL